ncbi:hypothetical protein C1S82_11225 [Mycolicibacterium cosmeticum]|uniref:LGFP repeat-containing protein n=1 Tax=Mycolicibacterium cosmeticum TaxID=258533 RepID=W9B849_MYCCO|nr:alanine and glycine rich protein [Mycolicibacterium cosmeticum]TLH73953.1 hypothetical protein C1S82_11225 [Mycolicibacterium cosmeticum]CDO10861.1 LGFP repeat-containing protein [Mycolicibacterium cosmeticum]
MTRQRTRLRTAAGRALLGLAGPVLVAAMVLYAAPAFATPESDADAAISAAWDGAGGDTGPLGAKDGGVYAVGAGFGQNFAGGKIFFTPETGAHIMTGAILDKYQSLGGPADSDLGFPTIDEGPGRAPDSRNSTFSAADNPVIFWTPDNGARVVRGPINAAWDKLGGSAAVLGVPSGDETSRGDVISQQFTGGEVSWNRKTKQFTTTPPELADQLAGLEVPSDATSEIAAARRAAGGALGPLGAPDGGQYAIGSDGVGQNFAGGKIFYSPATGANVVTGQVLAKYESVGGPTGDLGFPTASEADGGLAPASRFVPFAAADQPVIFWTPDFGAVIVRGAMNAAWQKLGGATGELGAPKSDQTENGDVISQQFSGGSISWNRATHTFTTEPANLQSQLAGLEVPGADAPKAPAAEPTGDNGNKWYTWSWWWLLGLIPLLALIGLIVVAVLRNRRSRADQFAGEHYDEYESGYHEGYEHAGYDGAGYDQADFDRAGRDPAGFDEAGFDEAGFDEAGYDSHEPDDYESGPAGFGQEPGGYSPQSPWALSVPRAGDAPDAPDTDDDGDDADFVDTAPTRIESDVPAEAPEEAAAEPTAEPAADTDSEPPTTGVSLVGGLPPIPRSTYEPDFPSGRHAAIQIEEPDPARTSVRPAGSDPFRAPDGYLVKADTGTGLYWTPGTPGYDQTPAEIWFASEEFAVTNGFVRAD